MKKVRANVYKGFSIGGKITGRDCVDKSTITGIKLVEVSLVDRPANPEAVFTMFKAEMVSEPEGENNVPEDVLVDAPVDEASLAEADIEKQAIAEIVRLVKSGEMTSSEILRRVMAGDAPASNEMGKVEALHKADVERIEALHKTQIEQLEKRAEEALLKLAEIQDEKENLTQRVAALEALPEPARAQLMAISKAEDGGGGLEPFVAPVRKGDGNIDEVATEIKKIQRLNGKKIWG